MKLKSRKYKKLMKIRLKNRLRYTRRQPKDATITSFFGTISMEEFINMGYVLHKSY